MEEIIYLEWDRLAIFSGLVARGAIGRDLRNRVSLNILVGMGKSTVETRFLVWSRSGGRSGGS
ncbi:MAG: hypothetical protein AB4352_08955 [Hormoscilla sp.]